MCKQLKHLKKGKLKEALEAIQPALENSQTAGRLKHGSITEISVLI